MYIFRLLSVLTICKLKDYLFTCVIHISTKTPREYDAKNNVLF